MSLLAAFVAMLGKQWLNRYLRHWKVDDRMLRQRKFDGLEKWGFRLFFESLPIMLQIALLLACGLSQYMWSVNTSVARVIISFTALGILFYIGIVAAGTSSYGCPFQTPASIGLRNLRDDKTTRKLLANLSPPNFTRSSAPLGRTPGRRRAMSTRSRDLHRLGRFRRLASDPASTLRPGRSDTKPSFSFSGLIALSGT